MTECNPVSSVPYNYDLMSHLKHLINTSSLGWNITKILRSKAELCLGTCQLEMKMVIEHS
jgi:hypothetical protein